MRQEPEQIIRQYSLAFKKQIVKEVAEKSIQLYNKFVEQNTILITKVLNIAGTGIQTESLLARSGEWPEQAATFKLTK